MPAGVAEARDSHQVSLELRLGELAGRVTREGEREVVGLDAFPVVTHTEELLATVLEVHRDLRGVSIEGVFDQLLEHAPRSFDDLTRRDPVDHVRGQDANHAHICVLLLGLP